MIPSVEHKRRGTSTCKAANYAGVRSQSVELRVNGTITSTCVWEGTFHFY